MTHDDTSRSSSPSRKMKRLAVGILVVLVVYTAGWFLAAHQIEQRLTSAIAERARAGSPAGCTDMDVRGYPFRIGVFCQSVKVDDAQRGASASFGAFRSAAQVYQPGHAVLELDGPAEIRVTPDISLSANWSLLHASVQAGLSGVQRTSLTYDDLAGTLLATPERPGIRFDATHGEAHLRQNGPDLDTALSVTGLDLKIAEGGPRILPVLASTLDVTFADRGSLLGQGRFPPGALRGSKGDMRNLTLDLGNGMLAQASGRFSVDDDGLISGAFNVTMKDIEGWRKNLTGSFPDEDSVSLINNIANMLTALSNGRNEATVNLNVRDGTAFLAFFPIGELPRL